MTVQGSNLGLFFGFEDGFDGWGGAYNDLASAVEYLTFAQVKSSSLAVAPGAPVEGDCYIVAAGAGGAWAGKAKSFAVWSQNRWTFFAPHVGWRVFNVTLNKFLLFDGADWVDDKATVAEGRAGIIESKASTPASSAVNRIMPLGNVDGDGALYTASCPFIGDGEEPILDETFAFTPDVVNAGAVTLAVNGDAARPLFDAAGVALVPGDLRAGDIYIIRRTADGYRAITVIAKASQADAEGGVNNSKPMTALRVLQAIMKSYADRGIEITSGGSWDLAFADILGYVYLGIRSNDVYLGRAGASKNIAQFNNEGRNLSCSLPRRHGLRNTELLRADRVGILGVGQSYMVGLNTRVPLSIVPHTDYNGNNDVFTPGLSVRSDSANTNSSTWIPQGAVGFALQPAVATTDNSSGAAGIAPANAAYIAALGPASGRAENYLNAMGNNLASMWNANPQAQSKKWVIATSAVGGKTIEQLSKNPTQYDPTFANLYNRNIDLINGMVADAANSNESFAIGFVVCDQGQDNYNEPTHGTQDKDTYKTRLKQYRTDLNADIRLLTGQKYDPIWLFLQTSGNWIEDSVKTAMSVAQVEICREMPGLCVMVGPTYDVTDNRDMGDAHLTSNGARWVGERLAQVAYRVGVEGYLWEPIYPWKIETSDNTVFINYVTPEPLEFAATFNGCVAKYFTAKGFYVEDGAGGTGIYGGNKATVVAVEIVGSATVKLTCDRTLDPATTVVAGGTDTQHNGNTNVFAATRTPSQNNYVYDGSASPGLNMPAVENCADENGVLLAGRPYPSRWPTCVFYLPGTYLYQEAA